MIFGHVFDLKEQKDLTAPVLESLSSLDVSKLPLADSFKRVKGKGERVLYVFSDPDCPFCKQLEPELSKLDNVTIYTFPYPIPSLHPDATRKATAMWCAPDRAKAWDDWFALNVIPDSKPCDTPISRNAALGASLQINGTPTLIFANGVIKPGYIPAAEIEKRLSGSMGATAQTVKSGS
jgi:thiol:disulfide interchange protein DsbC